MNIIRNVGPLRIWESGDDATGPGIAITRSFGDYNGNLFIYKTINLFINNYLLLLAKKIGSLSVPTIEHIKLDIGD